MRVKKTDLLALMVVVVSVIITLMTFFSTRALGSPNDLIEATAEDILTLQPSLDEDRARRLAGLIVEASEESELEPALVVAVANRESAFLPEVESLELLGSRGERGLLQVHGAGLVFRPDGCSTRLEGARCQIETGARFLAWVRDRCGGSTWRWLGAYGMSRCPSEDEARQLKSTRVARRHYDAINGQRWTD